MLDSESEKNDKILIEETYSDKSIKFLTFSILILAFDLIIYIIFLYIGYNDFGMYFETASLFLSIISVNLVKNKKFSMAKSTILGAAFPICWLFVYDLIDLFANFENVFVEMSAIYITDTAYFYYVLPYLFDIVSIVLIILFFKAHSSLSIADGTKVKDSYSKSFYDKM